MATNDTLCFADFDPVTGAPGAPDGFFLPDIGVITNEVEPGYVNGCRMTFGGSGLPPVVFQGVRNGNFLHLAFLCRLDFSFDNEDVVVIALRPSQANPDQSTARRIDIFPVYGGDLFPDGSINIGVGADEKNATTGGPAGVPDDTPSGIPNGSNYHIRTNHMPQRKSFWRGQSGGAGVAPWVAYTPAIPLVYDIKVRSWKPPVPSTAPIECAWSIEVKIPIDIETGGSDWIDLEDGFGLYFNVIRVGKTSVSGATPSQGWYSTQFRFPSDVSSNALTGILNENLIINPLWYGMGLIPAFQQPPGNNRGQGVRFHNDELGVGRRDMGSSTLTLGHQISGTVDNELVALVDNTSTTAAAANVTAEFRFANWGFGPSPAAGFTSWAKPTGGLSPNPTTPISLSANSFTNVMKADWPASAVPNEYKQHDHQCVWVQLSSNSGVNFVQSSVRRNMDFINLSEYERPAEISGVGYPPPSTGNHHDFLLFTHARKIITPKYDDRVGGVFNIRNTVEVGGENTSDWVHYLWVTEGYRRTGQTLTIGTKTTEVLDESPGAFGFIAQHQGIDDVLEWSLTGSGIHKHSAGISSIKVPDGGSVTINTKLKAAPVKPKYKWPWWVWLLIAIILLLILLF